MIEQTCSTCRWWQRSPNGQPDDHTGPDKTPEGDFLRECHRFPPRIAHDGKCEVEHERPDGSTYTLEHGWYGAWPLTFEDDCCGEYAPVAPRAAVRRGPLGSPGEPAGSPAAQPETPPRPSVDVGGQGGQGGPPPKSGQDRPESHAPDTSPLRSPPPTNACIHEFVHAVLLERGPLCATDIRTIVDATRGTESGKTTIASTISQKSWLYGWITDSQDYRSPALWRVGTPAELAAAEDAGRVARAAGEDMDASPYRVADARTASWQKGWTEAALRSAAPTDTVSSAPCTADAADRPRPGPASDGASRAITPTAESSARPGVNGPSAPTPADAPSAAPTPASSSSAGRSPPDHAPPAAAPRPSLTTRTTGTPAGSSGSAAPATADTTTGLRPSALRAATVSRGTLPPEVAPSPTPDASQASPGLPGPVRLDPPVIRRKPKPAEAPPEPPEAPPGAPEPASAPQDGRRRTLVEAVLAFLQAEGGWWSTQGVRDRLPPRLPVPEDRDVWMALGTLVDAGRAEKKPDPTRPRAFVYHAV